jgi:hypothetical protein
LEKEKKKKKKALGFFKKFFFALNKKLIDILHVVDDSLKKFPFFSGLQTKLLRFLSRFSKALEQTF